MKEYVIFAFLSVALFTLVKIALPKGKINSAATFVISAAMFLCLLKPVFALFSSDKTKTVFGKSREFSEATEVTNYIDRKTEEYYEKAYCEVLKRDNLICEKVNVEICDNKIKKIEIYLSNLVIAENDEHININVIADYVADLIGEEREIVCVYG